MLRRSSRLQTNGYYDSDGKPVISYKETINRVFKKRRFGFCARFDPSPDTEFDATLDLPKETGPANRPWRTVLFILLFLCVGLFWTLAIPTGFSTTTVTKLQAFTESSDDVWIHLKELREELKELKEKMELLHPLADTMPNFALEILGAKIIYEKTSESYPPEDRGFKFFGITVIPDRQPPPVSPTILLQGLDPKIPGQCWAFKGSKGQLSLELPVSIMVSYVSIGHIPKNISPEETTSSAPRMFSVFAKNYMEDAKIYLGTFEYDARGRPLQTFETTNRGRNVVKYVSVQIHNNWGNNLYTCIYSFRVHGKLAP